MNKKIKKSIFLFFCMITLGLSVEVKALEVKYNYTKEYLEWLNLSDDEKQNVMIPKMTEVNYSNEGSNSPWKDNTSFINDLIPIGSIELSSRFNLAEEINVKVKDQGITNECWAFSTYSSLECSLLYSSGIDIDFSERHMNYATSSTFYDAENIDLEYKRDAKLGALPETGLAYLTNGQGAVLENEMPFENNYESISINDINIKPSYYVTNYRQFPSIYKTYNEDGSIDYSDSYGIAYTNNTVSNIREEIKEYLVTTGPITSVMASEYLEGYNNQEDIFASTTYCCKDATQERDHSITIVGWDDNYSKDNFNSQNKPNEDGAYIVLQSYGEKCFDNGYMYISYEDCLIETSLYGIYEAKEYDYDKLYQHNYYGTTGTLYLNGYSTGYQAMTFDRDLTENEFLSKIAFNLPEKANVKLWINPNGEDLSKENLINVSSKILDLEAGYHTIDINPVKLTSNKFSIVLMQESQSENFNFNVEFKADKIFYANVTSESGRNKISIDGENWLDLEDLSDDELINTTDLCIKAFTVESEEMDSELPEYDDSVPELPEESIPEKPEISDTKVTSEKYVIDSQYIKNIEAYTTVDEFWENMNIESNKIELLWYKLNENDELDVLRTGMKLQLDNKEYILVVKGDINGDGKISLIDLSALIAHYAEIPDCYMNELKQVAGDMNVDGKISLIDLSKLLVIYSQL